MGLNVNPNEVIQSLDLKPSTGPVTGFKENFGAQYDFMVREGQSISANRAVNERLIESVEALQEAGVEIDTGFLLESGNTQSGVGTVGSDVRQFFNREARKKYEDAVKQVQPVSAGDTRIQSFSEIDEDIKIDMARAREELFDITSRAQGAGKAGNVLGTLGGAVADPTVVATLPFGASWGQGILRAMAIEGLIATGVEIPIQAQIFSFKKEIGSPYSLSDAALSVIGAGVGGAAFAGALRAIPRGGRELVKYIRNEQKEGRLRTSNAKEEEAMQILEAIDDEMSVSPFPRDAADDVIHTEHLQKSMDDIVDDRPRVSDDNNTGTVIRVDDEDIPIPGKLASDLEEAEIRAKNPTVEINTPERLALRARITDELYGKGAKIKRRRADIVLGTPGVGKTSAVAEPLAKQKGSIIVDPDDAKVKIPEFDNGKGSVQVHGESSDIAADLLIRAMNNGDNIVLSNTGKTLNSLVERVNILKENGYSVHLHLVDLPTPEAVKRTITRHAETGRLVPPGMVKDIGLKPKENFNLLRKKGELDGFTEWDNNVQFGTPPRLVATTEKEFVRGFRGRRTRSTQAQTQAAQEIQEQGGVTGTYLTDEARMANARAALEQFNEATATAAERIDADYNRVISETPASTKIPIGERIDNDGNITTEFTTVKQLADEVEKTENARRLVDNCIPAAA